MRRYIFVVALGFVPVAFLVSNPPLAGQTPRDYPFKILEGKVEEFSYTRNWRHYYWRDDFSMLVRATDGQTHRVISREPTPWAGYRLGTTYTGLAVDWTRQPKVQIIGVQAVDRQPEEFYDLKLEPQKIVTAFILRVQTDGKEWRDFYINNWFHKWGADTDRKILPYYANNDKNYDIYGYVNGAATPFNAAGQALLKKYEVEYGGLIYRGRIEPAKNEVGHEIRLLNLLGRHKKTLNYDVFHGDPSAVVQLDGKAPPKK